MDINILHSSVKPLYKSYNEVIKPLIAEIEARGQTFPLPLFNEIRAFNDHIAQCFWDDFTLEMVDFEVHKAEGHVLRMVLDCYKVLILFLNDKVLGFEKQTNHIDLTVINNGVFYIEYRRLKKASIEMVRKAKSDESRNNGQAIIEFEKAYNLYTALGDLIDSNLFEVNWAKKKFTVIRALKILGWLLAVIISGFVSLLFTCDSVSQFVIKLFNHPVPPVS